MKWGSPAEKETQRRMFLAVCAYAYEVRQPPISLTDDHNFDAECKLVDLAMDTGYPAWDAWWRTHFKPHTGQWIWKHPDHAGLARIVDCFLADDWSIGR
jgi:hypothetical protein